MCERRESGVIGISRAMKLPSAHAPAVQTMQTSTRLFPITRTWWVKSYSLLSAAPPPLHPPRHSDVPLLAAETGTTLSPTSGDAELRLSESLSRTEFLAGERGEEKRWGPNRWPPAEVKLPNTPHGSRGWASHPAGQQNKCADGESQVISVLQVGRICTQWGQFFENSQKQKWIVEFVALSGISSHPGVSGGPEAKQDTQSRPHFPSIPGTSWCYPGAGGRSLGREDVGDYNNEFCNIEATFTVDSIFSY